MGQHTAGTCAVGEELRAEFLCGDAEADSVLLDGDGRVADDAVEAQSGNVQHILRLQQKLLAVAVGVGVRQVALGIPVHRHLIRLQRMDADHLIAASADDLTVGVAPQQQMRHHGLPQDKAGHFQIRLIVQKSVQRMLRRLAVARVRVFVHVDGQGGDGFSDHAHTGVDRGHLDRRGCGDRFAGHAGAESEGRRGADGVLRIGLVPRTSEAGKWIFHRHLRYRPEPVLRS